MRDDLDQRFGLQQLQRLAHRDDGDVQAARQIVDDQALTRLQLAPQDRVAQGPVDELLLGPVWGSGQGAKRHAFLGGNGYRTYGVEPIMRYPTGPLRG